MKKTKKVNIRALTITAIMGALSSILMMLEFPIPIMPPFIKMDFSELPALITSFTFGPFWGITVCLIKNLVHCCIGTTTAYIGETSNFILGAIFVGIAGFIYQRKKNKSMALVSCISSSLTTAVISVFTNYYIVYPLYVKLLSGMTEEKILSMYTDILPSADNLFKAIVIFNLPFNFIKLMIVSLICFVLYKKLSSILKKR